MSNFDALVAKLREIFQIDRPDLDFGVYRILNARAGEIEDYLSKRLKARVAEALAAGAAANTETLKAAIAKARESAEAAGYNPDEAPKVLSLQKELAAASTGASEHENQVFSHLLTFFSRYYDKGDFISQRRYKGDTYAIPYSGEEVVLHWANRDQYYTKSGESFSNFSFKLDDGRVVHFRLVAADTAKDNRKDNDKERRFVLAAARTVTRTDEDGETYEETIHPVAEEDGALVIRFDFAAQPKGTKQETLVDKAVEAILDDEAVKARWLSLTNRAPTEKNPKRTLLEKHLTTYTQKNTADYFIHKDLGGFLRRELDFYIKNEVMNLDDVQEAGTFAAIEKNLRMIQCLRAIALDLTTFLASIEDFQKKLWLKKKFVVAAQYCVTLDRVPQALHASIAANPAQWAQWHGLGMRASAASGTVADLKTQPFLMVDTALFDAGFRADLLKAIPNLDVSLDGLLVHGDNFQGLTLLQERYRDAFNCIYIDPPYNTDASAIDYKNGYKSSSWITLLDSRLRASKSLLKPDGVLLAAIDDAQFRELSFLADEVFEKMLGTFAVRANPSGRPTKTGYSVSHEYMIAVGRSEKSFIGRLPPTEAQRSRFNQIDEDGPFEWRNMRREGSNSDRTARSRLYYPMYLSGSSIRVPKMEWSDDNDAWTILEQPRRPPCQ
jgi:adenine-specific DNA-methyltransferase